MVIINCLSEAKEYWKSNRGGTVQAGDRLIMEMKMALNPIFDDDIIEIVRKKIKEARRDGTYHIRSASGSRRGCWCLTLGSFSVNIEYDYSFSPETKHHFVEFHLFGYDTWDFEFKKCQWYDIPSHIHNFCEEFLPRNIWAGEGTPFDIEYDFYWTHDFNENPSFFETFAKIASKID
jgi:hypothetical protein